MFRLLSFESFSGTFPLPRGFSILLSFSLTIFRMNTYEKCVCNCLWNEHLQIIRLKVPLESTLIKKQGWGGAIMVNQISDERYLLAPNVSCEGSRAVGFWARDLLRARIAPRSTSLEEAMMTQEAGREPARPPQDLERLLVSRERAGDVGCCRYPLSGRMCYNHARRGTCREALPSVRASRAD